MFFLELSCFFDDPAGIDNFRAIEHRLNSCEWAYFVPGNVGSSRIRQRTSVSYIGKWIILLLSHQGRPILTLDCNFPIVKSTVSVNEISVFQGVRRCKN